MRIERSFKNFWYGIHENTQVQNRNRNIFYMKNPKNKSICLITNENWKFQLKSGLNTVLNFLFILNEFYHDKNENISSPFSLFPYAFPNENLKNAEIINLNKHKKETHPLMMIWFQATYATQLMIHNELIHLNILFFFFLFQYFNHFLFIFNFFLFVVVSIILSQTFNSLRANN